MLTVLGLEVCSLVEETQYFSSRLFASRFFVGHDPVRSTDQNVTELTRRKKIDNPLLEITNLDIKPRANDTALVDAASQFNDNLAGSVIIDNLEFSNVTCDRSYGRVTVKVSVFLCECDILCQR